MAQNFLLSSKARTLSLAKVLRLSDNQAFQTFKAIRWSDNDGQPYCPHCGCTAVYEYRARRIFRCQGCEKQFSVTSGTIFASRKLTFRDYLAAIAIFCNGAKGISALQLSRDLDVQYRTAFVLAHKLRETMAAESSGHKLSGIVEVDGAYFGGHIRQENRKEDRKDRRLKEHQTGKRKCVVIMRERNGRSLPHVCKYEDDAIPTILDRAARGTTIHADEASSWDVLHGHYKAHRINHVISFSDDGACTNQAESYFSRLRRAEIGTHHHISGKYLHQYANEMAWREDHRRISNGEQYLKITGAALAHPVSREWKGYWQKCQLKD
jgi:transposase-like protein